MWVIPVKVMQPLAEHVVVASIDEIACDAWHFDFLLLGLQKKGSGRVLVTTTYAAPTRRD